MMFMQEHSISLDRERSISSTITGLQNLTTCLLEAGVPMLVAWKVTERVATVS